MPNSCCGGTNSKRRKTGGGCGCSTAPTAEAIQEAPNHEPVERVIPKEKWIIGTVDTAVGPVPRVSTSLTAADRLGSWKARWSIGRMDYAVEPGLYCVGNPGDLSPVLVTANYKMTLDRVRMELDGVDAWILVLDTDGINVWCAAGKGTFGTDELTGRIASSGLARVVAHRMVVLPQLGATGVSAHLVRKRSGFRVVYGPVRAADIKAFLQAGMTATEEMRTVRFGFADRAVLAPMELVGALKPLLFLFAAMFLLNAVGLGHYALEDVVGFLGAVVAGCVLTPLLLPWIPGRAFSLKGLILGLLLTAGFGLLYGLPAEPSFGWLKAAAYLLTLPAVSAFAALNFTGSSTYTSLSGVDREMKVALPATLLSAVAGVVLFLVNDCIHAFG